MTIAVDLGRKATKQTIVVVFWFIEILFYFLAKIKHSACAINNSVCAGCFLLSYDHLESHDGFEQKWLI